MGSNYGDDFGEEGSPLVQELNRLEDERFAAEERERFDRATRRYPRSKDDTDLPCTHESGWCDCDARADPPRGLDTLLVPTLKQRRSLSQREALSDAPTQRLDSWATKDKRKLAGAEPSEGSES
jgi:hypothetical protein